MSRQDPVVVIVRDRASSGGGIYNYYTVIAPHLNGRVELCNCGKPFVFYGDHKGFGARILDNTPVRLMIDSLALAFKILRYWPDVVLLNPCLDPPTYRSLRRDAVNILIARLFRRRVLSFWRGWENAYSGRPEFPGGNKSLLSRIFRMAQMHIVLSGKFKEDLLRWNFKTPVHVETTVVGDECLAGSAQPPGPEKARTNLLYLSRVEVAKGVFELLDAYRILKSRNPAYTLTIGGDGPDLEALKAYAKELDLKDVSFTGFLKGKAKIECFQQGSVFCFLSYTEGMPNAVLEALAMGMPIVSSDAGGLKDILRNGENGFIVPPLEGAVARKKFDPKVVADAIERLVENRESYERVATVNWRYARQRFAAPFVAKRLEEIYRSLSNERKVFSEVNSKNEIPVFPK